MMMERRLLVLGFVLIGTILSAGPAWSQSAQGAKPGTAKATFAGGCFWCMEEAFDKVPGVVATTSGYIGGQTKSPTYEQVTTGRTGHAEAVLVEYDPAKVTYQRLLE